MKNSLSTAKKVLAVVLAFAMSVSAITFSPAKNVQAAKKKGKVKSVTVTTLPAKTLTLKKGKSKVLKVGVKTSKKKVSKAYTFKSSKPSVVKVTKKGKSIKVTAKKKGKANIVIKSKANPKKKTTIKVTVGTPVNKVKLNKKKATIAKGGKVTLKAKVTPKKPSNKKVVWTTSNKKKATVNNKGVVTGKAAGKVKITAKAADGSGKKATCTVTVVDSNDVSAVNVINSYAISVSLKKAQPLSINAFTVKTKSYENGTYNRICEIESAITNDNKTYTLILKSEYGISRNNRIQVAVKGLTGVKGDKVVETTYTRDKVTGERDRIVEMTYNERCYKTVSLVGYGYETVSFANLPAGINARVSSGGGSMEFYGTPSVKGKYVATAVAKDELGNEYKFNITFIIGAEDAIAAAVSKDYAVIGTKDVTTYADIEVVGGSGSYTYEIISGNGEFQIDDYDYSEIQGTFKTAGNYSTNVKVTDRNNTALSTIVTYEVSVKQGYTVSGIVKDADGNAINKASVYFTNRNEEDKYCDGAYASFDEKGVYSAIVTEGTYDIEASVGYDEEIHNYLLGQSFNASKSGVDITLPVYKIVVITNDSRINAGNIGTWYTEKEDGIGSGDVLYLKAGKSYNLTSEGSVNNYEKVTDEDGYTYDKYVSTTDYELSLNINVTKSETVNASVKTLRTYYDD